MEINWAILAPIAVLFIIMMIYMIRKNKEDRRDVEQHFNNIPKKDESEPNDGDDGI
jgi:preprotein translocase subunit YajC